MKRLSFLVAFAVTRLLLADPIHTVDNIHIQCDGKDYGDLSPFILKADLVTAAPMLVSAMFKKIDNGDLQTVETKAYVLKDEVCGVKVDFEKDCTSRVRQMADDYSFEFNCPGKVSGEAYTNFATPTQGILTVQCHGQDSVTFENCKIANP